jgi:hypothetical protein
MPAEAEEKWDKMLLLGEAWKLVWGIDNICCFICCGEACRAMFTDGR